MDKVLSTLIIFVFGLSAAAQNRAATSGHEDNVILSRDTAMSNLLSKVDFNKYIGRTVADLLANDTIRQYKEYWWANEPPGILSSLNLTYARGIYLEISANNLKYTRRFSETLSFDIELFKKEKITRLKINKDYFEKYVLPKYKN